MQKPAGILPGLFVFLILALLPLDHQAFPVPAQLATAVTGLMLVWWVTEAIPISATALVPLVLFPVLGILSPQEAAISYADQTVFLFMGGFLIAAAMVRWNLHKRIALILLHRAGAGTRRLLLGFMAATAFLSMWISNTATAMMMIPIALALVPTLMPGSVSAPDGEQRGKREFATCLVLGVAYAATIGGMATLIGTPPNGILAAQLAGIFPGSSGLDFFSWMVFAVPFMVIFLLLAWLWLTAVAFRHLPAAIAGTGDIIARELASLGPLTRGEQRTLLVFLAVALGWIFRTPKAIGSLVIPGITTYVPGVTDAIIAICGALVLFMLPADAGNRALDWESAKGIPWGILILFGGGICLSAGIIASGLADLIARSFVLLAALPLVAIILLVTLFITFLNEVVSNTAVASIMIPLMAITSVSMGINPLMLMIPVALASSLGFILPVGTPPNAIAYGTGYVPPREMARAGFALNIIGCILITIFMAFFIPAALGISPELPAWAVIAGK